MSKKIKIDGLMELNKACGYLEDLLASLKQGKLHIAVGADAITLVPDGIVDFEMEVSQKKEKEKLSIEFSWKKDETIISGEDLKIGEE